MQRPVGAILRHMRRPQPKSFERFYYERVGIGEGCGCAELIIGVQDQETAAGQPKAHTVRVPGKVWVFLGCLLRRLRANR